MNNKYVIQWKSKVNGRAGKGTKLFEHEEAKELAEELNTEYPQIHHEPVEFKAAAELPGSESNTAGESKEVVEPLELVATE